MPVGFTIDGNKKMKETCSSCLGPLGRPAEGGPQDWCAECEEILSAYDDGREKNEEKELKEYLISNNNNMTEMNYTTGTVNKASMDRYGLEGERLILFGLNKDDDHNTFIQFNYVADKEMWLCCLCVSDGKAYISILNEDEVKSKVKEILKKWNWEGHHELWEMIHGETIVCDTWNIAYDGEDFTRCEDCGNNKEPNGECFDCVININEVQNFGTINASFDVCMEKNVEQVKSVTVEQVKSVTVENKVKRIVKPKKSKV
jgi:hypothetical protein